MSPGLYELPDAPGLDTLQPDWAQDPTEEELRAYAREQERRYGLSAGTYEPQITQESGWNVRAESPVGARGLAQFMPATAAAEGIDPLNWRQSLEAGARYRRKLQDYFGGDERAGAAAYNFGPGNVEALKRQYGSDWEQHLPGETKTYLQAVFGGGGGQQRSAYLNPDVAADNTTIAEQMLVQEEANRASFDPRALEQARDRKLRAILGEGILGNPLEKAASVYDTLNVDIPVVSDAARAAKKFVAEQVNANPGVLPGYNVGRALMAQIFGVEAPSAGELVASPIPTGAVDWALTLSPAIAGKVARDLPWVIERAQLTFAESRTGRALAGLTPTYRGAAEGAAVIDEAGNVVQDAAQAARPVAQRAGGQVLDEFGNVVAADTSGTNALIREFEASGMSYEEARAAATTRAPQMVQQQQMAPRNAIQGRDAGRAQARAYESAEPPGGLRPKANELREVFRANDEMHFAGEGLQWQPESLGLPLRDDIAAARDEIAANPKGRTAELGRLDAQLRVYRALDQHPNPAAALNAVADDLATMHGSTPAARATIAELQRVHNEMLDESGANLNYNALEQHGGAGAPPGEPPPVNLDDIRGRFLRAAQQERNMRATGQVAREIRQGRAAQAGGVADVAAGGPQTLAEAGAAARGAMYQGGSLRKGSLTPIHLHPHEETAIVGELSQMVNDRKLSPFEYYRFVAPATSDQPGIIARLTSETPRLQPAEVKLIRRVWGDEFANAVAERSGNAAEPRMTPMQERRLMEQARAVEQRQLDKAQKAAAEAEQKRTRETVKAQETKDRADIRTANREAARALRLQAEAEAAEFQDNMRALDAMSSKVRNMRRRDAIEMGQARRAEAAINEKLPKQEQAQLSKQNAAEVKAAEKHDAMDPNYDQLFRKAETVATQLGPAGAGTTHAAEIIKYQLQGNRRILDWTWTSEGLDRMAQTVRAFFTGDLADSYLTALLRRTETLRAALLADGMGERNANIVANTMRDAELQYRYTNSGGVPENIKALLAETKGAGYGDSWGALDKFIQRWKNTVYSTDFGVVGTQLKATIDRGGLAMLPGLVNRTLSFLHLPHASLYSADVNLPNQLRDILDGVYTGSAVSPVEAKQGTLYSYALERMGVPGQKVDAAIEWFLNKGNDLQFKGILGYVRSLSYESNLTLLKLMGRNIQDPKTRKTAADFANATTLFAQTALRSGRRGWERRILTSVPMLRSEIANVLQAAKFFEPGASADERILAGSLILSRLFAVLVMGKFINDQIGVGDYVMDPTQRGFGQVITQFKDANNRNVVISLFPQESLVKAFIKAGAAVADSDADEFTRALTQGVSGRLSLPGQLIENVAGWGYDETGRFHTGDLHLGLGGVLKKSFLPPIGQQYAENPASVYLGAQSIGVSAFPESVTSQADRQGLDYEQRKALQAQVDATGTGNPKSDLQNAADRAKQDRAVEMDGYEKAFQDGQLTHKLQDYWHDIGEQALGSGALQGAFLDEQGISAQSDFGKRFAGLIDGYRSQQVADGYGQIDWDATRQKQQEYLAGLNNQGQGNQPSDKQVFESYLRYAEGQKSPLRQEYDKYLQRKDQAGYFAIKADDPQRQAKLRALDKANPQIDAESWYWNGGVRDTNGDGISGGELQTPEAVDIALARNLPNRPIRFQGLPRPINQTPETVEAWRYSRSPILWYQEAGGQQNLEAERKRLAGQSAAFNKPLDELTPQQRGTIVGNIHEAMRRGSPELDAYLYWWGAVDKPLTQAASTIVEKQIFPKYGDKPPKKKAA